MSNPSTCPHAETSFIWLRNFWSSLVQLAHLYEMHSFRSQFQAALLQVVAESFSYIPVAGMPQEASTWMQRRREVLKLGPSADTLEQNYQVTRYRLHMQLMEYANGNTESATICHWCLGPCCKGENHAQKSRHALLQVSRCLILLFGNGFPFPCCTDGSMPVGLYNSVELLGFPWKGFQC